MTLQVVDAGDWRVAESNHQVAFFEAAESGRTAGLDRRDADRGFRRQVVEAHETARQLDIVAGDSDIGAAYLAVLDQMTGDELGAVDGDREADSLRRQDNRRVDADYLAARVDQRPSGVAGIQRGVGLDNVIDQSARSRSERSSKRTHHARSNAALETIRISNRDRELTHANRLRVTERHGGKVRTVDSNHG